jgi:hypothetical protein
MQIDPQVYDSPTFDTTLPERADAARAQYKAPENVPQASVLVGTQANAAAHVTEQANARQPVSLMASVNATVDEMSPMAVYRWATGPDFAHQEGFNAGEHLPGLTMQLSADERERLMKTKSQDEFDYWVGNIDRVNYNNRLMGDHPIASFGLQMIDPVYLGIDAASMGAGTLVAAARAGKGVQRLVSGVTSAAGAVGVSAIEGQSRVVSDFEVISGALLNGAGTAAFYSPLTRKLEVADKDFPSQKLAEVAQPITERPVSKAVDPTPVDPTAMPAVVPAVTPVAAPTPAATVRPARVEPTVSASATESPDARLPQELAGAKPRYAFGQKQFDLAFESDIDKASYIASQTKTSKADRQFVEFVQNAMGWSEGQVRAHGAEVRSALKAQAKTAEPGTLSLPKQLGKKAEATAAPVFEQTMKGGRMKPFTAGTETTAKDVLKHIIDTSGDPMMGTLARRLHALAEDVKVGVVGGVKRSAYHFGRNRIALAEGATDWTKMHEIAHSLTANRLRFGRTAPDTAIGGLAKQIDDLHVQAQKAAEGKPLTQEAKYYLKNADEFMAGLYSGHKEFYDFLRGIPTTGGNVLSKVVETVRKILGIPAGESNAFTRALGLTDEMMQQPLSVKTTIAELDGTHSMYESGLLHSAPADTPAGAASLIQNEDTHAIKIAKGVSWSLHKTLSGFGEDMRKAADLLVDNPLDMTGDSVVSQTRAIRAEFAPLQYAYEDKLKEVLASKGFGLLKRIFQPRQALEAQGKIEREVAIEMLTREQNQRLGKMHPANPDKDIKAMADSLDKLAKATLGEMKAAGVRGAEDVAESSGYFSRRWDIGKIEDIEARLVASGLTEDAAKSRLVRMLATGMRRANGWDAELAGDIAKSLIDRTRRKGYFEDSAFRSHAGNDNLAEIRDILNGAGIRGDRLQRAMDVLAGVTDEAGKAAVLKHRIDIDMKAGLQLPGGGFVNVADLIDTNMTNITERYLDTVAGRSGLARKGLEDQSAIDSLRKTALSSIKGEAERGRAAKLFDDTVAAIQGKPVGEDMPAFMRATQAATRMVGLASSGLWQVTEYAPMMARYGMLKTIGYMLREMPGARQLYTSISKDAGASTQLKDILTRNSSADIRMRPFVQRLEDNFEIPASAQVQLAMSQAQQLVPYMNAQKFVQSHQARVMANLMVDTLHKAAKGDKRAMHAMEQYGLKPDIMVELADDIKTHGMDTAKWSDGTWAKVRGPLTKAADDAVLRNRTGEIPAFAQFSQLGKFIFTFRSFVLGAHNKVLAGTLHRDGLAGLSLIMLYQFPLSALANLANATIQGKPIKDEKELVAKSLGQMGAFGMFSDAFGVISGQKQQFGAPGLIMIDRLYKAAGQAAQGNAAGTADAALSATPILSIIPGIRAIGAALKE